MTEPLNKAGLRECPFCGGALVHQPYINSPSDFYYWHEPKEDCPLDRYEMADTPETVAAWNRRASTPSPVATDGLSNNWFELSGDARFGSCATEGCGGQPIWRLEADGVGSNYCSGCASRIRALSQDPGGYYS